MADEWQQARLREMPINVLTVPELGSLIFQFGSYRMHWRYLDALRAKVYDRALSSEYVPKLGISASCNSSANTIVIGFDVLSRFSLVGLLLHECVHAAMDNAKHSKLTNGQSEAIAYVCQWVYLQQKGVGPTDMDFGGDEQLANISTQAALCAGYVIAKMAIPVVVS